MMHALRTSKLRYFVYALPAVILLAAAIVFVCAVIVNNNQAYMRDSPEAFTEFSPDGTKVALVLGGGIGRDNQPTDVVQSRLDAAAELYFSGVVEKILVSGDNRFVNYNEPFVMQNYLESRYGIPSSSIQQDSAGRSTYESCDRAKHIFGLDTLIVVSQRSHVPRAIYLCRSFGIEAYGFPAPEGYQRASQTFRELAANVKAVYNVVLFGEPTVYGDPIDL